MATTSGPGISFTKKSLSTVSSPACASSTAMRSHAGSDGAIASINVCGSDDVVDSCCKSSTVSAAPEHSASDGTRTLNGDTSTSRPRTESGMVTLGDSFALTNVHARFAPPLVVTHSSVEMNSTVSDCDTRKRGVGGEEERGKGKSW